MAFSLLILNFAIVNKMKMRSCFIILLLSLAFSTACSSDYLRIRKELTKFENNEIILPQDMILIVGDRVEPYQGSLSSAKTFFIYYPSVDCSDCLASKLASLVPLRSLAAEKGFEVKCVISPVEGVRSELINKLSGINLPDSLFIDQSDSFLTLNQDMPLDPRFHIFSTDSSGKLFFVGNPCSDVRLFKLFIKTLKHKLL